MTSNPATVASNPAGDFGIRTWVWMSEHKKTSFLLVFVAACTVSQLILISPVWGSTVYGLPADGLEDSHGVPLSRYTNLPFDQGGMTHPVRSARYLLASLLWMPYNFLVIAMIVMTDWILDFGWLEWIAAPVNLLITGLDEVLSGMGIVVIGALVGALIIAIGFLRGRTGKSIAEMGIVIVMFGVIATSMATPNEWITGEDGWISQSAEIGSGVGEEMTTDEAGGEEGSDSLVSGALIDMTLRDPMLHMSFGSNLADLEDCESRWNDNASDPEKSTEDIRTEVTNCHDSVEAANETNDLSFIGFYIMGAITALGVMFLLAVALIFLIKEVVMALFGAVNTVVKSYFALFPGGARYAFVNALMQTVVSVVMVGVYVWALMAYLWVIDLISQFLPGFMGPASLLFGVVVIIMAITIIMMKSQGKKVGQAISRALGRGGLSGSEGQPAKPSRLGAASRHAGQGMRNAYQRSRMMRAATTATRVGTAAASGGTSAAVQAGSMAAKKAGMGAAAKKVGTNMAAKQGTKAAMMGATKPAGATGPQTRQKTTKPGTLSTHGAAGAKRSLPASGAASTGQGVSTTPTPGAGVHETPAGPVSTLPAAGAQRRGLPAGQTQTSTGAVGPKPEIDSRHPHHGAGGSHLTPAGGTTHEQASDVEQARSSSAARPSSLPPGRYGNVWVHKDGTATTVLEGEAKSAPSTGKLDKAWTITSPEVPTARSKRQGTRGFSGGVERPTPSGATRQTTVTPTRDGRARSNQKAQQATQQRAAPQVQKPLRRAQKSRNDRGSQVVEKAQQATQQRAAPQVQKPLRRAQKSRNDRGSQVVEKAQQATQQRAAQRPEKQAPQSRVRRAAESQKGESR